MFKDSKNGQTHSEYDQPLILHRGKKEYTIEYGQTWKKIPIEEFRKRIHLMKHPYPESKTWLDGIFYGLFILACGIALGLIVSLF